MQHGSLPEDRKDDQQRVQNDQPPATESDDKSDDGFFNTWTKIRHYLREPLAEWLGVRSNKIKSIALSRCNALDRISLDNNRKLKVQFEQST